MQDQEYVENLPFLAQWEAPLRAKFIAGMQCLQATPLPAPLLEVIGFLMIDDDEIAALYVDRVLFIEYMKAEGLDHGSLPRLSMPPIPGYLDVFVVVPDRFEVVIGVPVHVKGGSDGGAVH